jgi:hypothetical protein
MADINIGRALSGLGAAFKNEMPAFIQQVRQEDLDAERRAQREMLNADRLFDRGIAAEDRAMRLSDRDRSMAASEASRLAAIDEKRQETLFIDSKIALDALNAGGAGLGAVLQKFTDRREVLPSMGVTNFNLTDDVIRLASSAFENPDDLLNLKNKLEGYVNTGIAYEVLDKPERTKYEFQGGRWVNPYDSTLLTASPVPDKTTQRQREISALSAQLKDNGTPDFKNVATNIVDGLITIDFSDDGTSATLTDRTKIITDPSNAITSIRFALPDRPQEEPPVGGTLFDLIGQEGNLGGVSGTAKAAFRELANQFGFDPYAEDIQGIQRLKAAGIGLINSLRQGERYIQGETTLIQDEIGDLSPSFFTTDIEIENKMISLDKTLRERLNTARTNANDPRLGEEERSAQIFLVNNLEDFLRLMGGPVGSDSGSSGGAGPDKLGDTAGNGAYVFTENGWEEVR